MAISWPSALVPRDVEWTLAARTIAAGQSLAGTTQRTRLDGGGFWTARLLDIPVHGTGLIRLARTIEALLDGGAEAVVVPLRDPLWTAAAASAYFSDDSPFAEGGGFAGDAGFSASLTAAAALRATSLTLTTAGGLLTGGEHFSIDHPIAGRRLYRIAALSGAVATIRPPLREATDAGAVLDFANPGCTMRLADPQSIALPLQWNRHGLMSPTFEEYFA